MGKKLFFRPQIFVNKPLKICEILNRTLAFEIGPPLSENWTRRTHLIGINVWPLSFKGIYSCLSTAKDKRVNIISSFVSVDGLKVHGVANDMVLIGDSIGS